MHCIICNMNFDFKKGKGISFRNRPICDECLFSLTFIFIDRYRERIRGYLKQELRLEYYDHQIDRQITDRQISAMLNITVI